MNFRKIAMAAAALALSASSVWAQPGAERPLLPFEDAPSPERLGTNSFGELRPVPGIHSEQPLTPDINDLITPPFGPKRYYLTIRYYAVNPWFRNIYTGEVLKPEQIIRSVQTTNPDWPGRGRPIEELLKDDPTTGEPLVQISGIFKDPNDPKSEMVIDENNEEAMQDWMDDQMAEADNAVEAAEASQLTIPKINPTPIWHAPFYGLYCIKIRICIPVFTIKTTPTVYQYYVRWPYRPFQPWCWSRWWWYRWRLINGVPRIYPWRPLCIPRAVWHRVGPHWVWNVTNVNIYRRWCLYGLRYYFVPFANRLQLLPRIAALNSSLSPATWLYPYPYPRVRYWPFRSYCTRWYWFRCIPWLTYRYSPPIIQAAFAVPKLNLGAGFVDLPDTVQRVLDNPNEPIFPLDPPKVDPENGYDHGNVDERFVQFFDTDSECADRPHESPLGDNDGNGFVTRSDIPRNILLERLEDKNNDTEDTDGSTAPK